MKSLLLILLFFNTCILSMEVNLDNEALHEFTRNKQRMIAVAQGKVNNPENNNFWKKYNQLGQLDEAAARSEFEQLSAKPEISEFYKSITSHAEYQAALHHAKNNMTDENWQAFRTKSAELSKIVLVNHQINCDRKGEFPAANHFNQNSQLNENQICLVIGSSYLVYYNRSIQRKTTGKPLPEIEITK